MLGGSTVLLFLGLPVAFSFLVINLLGAWLFLGGEPGLVQLARNSVGSVASFSLTPIPLFILMGEVLFHTGLAVKVIDGVERLIRQVPGRLAVVAVVAGTVFSAISGSTIATTAMLRRLMLPVLLARGYHPTIATGPLRHGAGAVLRRAADQDPDGRAARPRRHIGNDSLHHRRRDHLLADPVVLGREQRPGRADRRHGPLPARGDRGDDAAADFPRPF